MGRASADPEVDSSIEEIERGELGLELDGVLGRLCGEKVIWGAEGGSSEVEVMARR